MPVGVYSDASTDGTVQRLKGGVFSTDGVQAIVDTHSVFLPEQVRSPSSVIDHVIS